MLTTAPLLSVNVHFLCVLNNLMGAEPPTFLQCTKFKSVHRTGLVRVPLWSARHCDPGVIRLKRSIDLDPVEGAVVCERLKRSSSGARADGC